MIRWLSNRWNKRRTSAVERRLAAERDSLNERIRELEEDLEAERVKNRLHELEIERFAIIAERDRMRIKAEKDAYAERTETTDDAQYRAVG